MPTTVRLDVETELRLSALSAQTGRGKAFHLREFIERGLEDLDDYGLAAEVLQRVRNGEEAVRPLEEVERELGVAS